MSVFERSAEYGRLRRVIDGHNAGHYVLPAEILDAWTTAERMDEERRRPVPEQAQPARDRLVAALLDAADAGTGFPDGQELLEAELADRAATLRALPVAQATTVAQSRFVGLVLDQADELVTGPLRDALGEIVDHVKKVAVALRGFDQMNLDQLVTAPKATREGWASLEAVSTRYASLRQARHELVPSARTRDDDERLFGEVKNMLTVWPTAQRFGEPPWPATDGRRRLLWLINAGAELWMATGAEVTAHYEKTFAEELATMARARNVRAGVAAWGASRSGGF